MDSQKTDPLCFLYISCSPAFEGIPKTLHACVAPPQVFLKLPKLGAYGLYNSLHWGFESTSWSTRFSGPTSPTNRPAGIYHRFNLSTTATTASCGSRGSSLSRQGMSTLLWPRASLSRYSPRGAALFAWRTTSNKQAWWATGRKAPWLTWPTTLCRSPAGSTLSGESLSTRRDCSPQRGSCRCAAFLSSVALLMYTHIFISNYCV